MVAAGPFHLSSVAANVDPSKPFAHGVALNTTPLDDLMQQVRRCKVREWRVHYFFWYLHTNLPGSSLISLLCFMLFTRMLPPAASQTRAMYCAPPPPPLQPDVLILVGPFVDAEAELVAQAQTTDNLSANLGGVGKASAGVLAEINKHLQMAVTQTKVRQRR